MDVKIPAEVVDVDHREQLMGHMRQLLGAYASINPSAATNPIDALFAYRLLLGRMPALGHEMENLFALGNVPYRQFINSLLDSEEFGSKGGFFPAGHLLMAELEHFRFWFRSSDRDMGVQMGLGSYEQKTIALLPSLIKPGDICLDIGAQTGFFSMHMASLVGTSGKVIAFEPMPDSFEVLTKNVRENRFDRVVRTNQVACSSLAGEHHFIKRSGMLVASPPSADSFVMRTVRADDQVDGRVSFVKMDVEGHELSVMDGMPRILAEDRPVILTEVNEYWLRRAGSSGHALLQRLEDNGYRLTNTDTNELIDLRDLSLTELDSFNVLALPH